MFDPKERIKAKLSEQVVETKEVAVEEVENELTEATETLSKKMSARERFIASIMKQAGCEVIPTLESIFKNHQNSVKMKIKDIGVFTTNSPGDYEKNEKNGEILNELSKILPIQNTLNLSTEVSLKRVKEVAIETLRIGRLCMTIEVAKLSDGAMNTQCWAGCHRLAVLAILYGADAEIPVSISNLTTKEARDNVIIANTSRKVKGLEQIEHAALRVCDTGDIKEADRDKLYDVMAKNKKGVVRYAMTSIVLQQAHGMKLGFKVSNSGSRSNGEMTTVMGVENFISTAFTDWNKEMSRVETDKEMKNVIHFLNELVVNLKDTEGFDPSQHLSTQAMVAIGHIYSKLKKKATEMDVTAAEYAPLVAVSLVGLGEIGREKSDSIYKKLYHEVHKMLDAK